MEEEAALADRVGVVPGAGEVGGDVDAVELWARGQRDEALRIWREGLLLSNDNETLQGTLKRLQVKP